MPDALVLDAVIIGGGAAGLWTLDRLTARGLQVLLLEAYELGSGQTVASQGIIHGGLKYTLSGMLTPSAKAIREMPQIWRECLAGEREPKLTKTIVRSPSCHLWRTESMTSRMGMIGARFGLRAASVAVAEEARPKALTNCPGTVAKVDEQVIDARSFIAELAERHHDRILKIDFSSGIKFARESRGLVVSLHGDGAELEILADRLILTAGEGNDAIRRELKMEPSIMQRRPLHMVMLRGRAGSELPPLFGHCVDGAKTRVTITSATDSMGRIVWQVGGQVAEDGVNMSTSDLIQHAKQEMNTALAGFDLGDVEWETYRVNRAELASGGSRPDDVALVHDGNVMTVWPTKLALAPRVAENVVSMMEAARRATPHAATRMNEDLRDWPRPRVALPPWETATQWFTGA